MLIIVRGFANETPRMEATLEAWNKVVTWRNTIGYYEFFDNKLPGISLSLLSLRPSISRSHDPSRSLSHTLSLPRSLIYITHTHTHTHTHTYADVLGYIQAQKTSISGGLSRFMAATSISAPSSYISL